MRSPSARFLLLLGALSAGLVLYFHQEESANPFSRLLPVFALVEEHSLQADRWGAEAYDKAIVEGHVYGEKAPLSSLVILPFYWLMRVGSHTPQSAQDRVNAIHMGNLLCGGIPFAVFVVLVFLRVRRSNQVSPQTATWMALACGFSSFLFNYGGCNFGHMLAATVFLGCYVLAVDRQEHFVLAGILGGCAVLAEYPTALLVAGVLGYLALGPDRKQRAGRFLLGGAPCAVFLMAYNWAITGSPFDPAYIHTPDYLRVAGPGVQIPNPEILYELLLGQFRGAAVYAPLLFLFLPLLAFKFPGGVPRSRLLWALGAVMLAFVASYNQWWGGWCTGPRHLTVITAVFLYEGAGVCSENPSFLRLFNPLAWVGIAINLLAVSTNPCPPDRAQHPIFEVFWVRFQQGATADSIPNDFFGMARGRDQVYLWIALFIVALVGLRWLSEQVYQAGSAQQRKPVE